MLMRKMLMTLAAGFLAAGAGAQSLALHNVNYPGIYCHFNSGCSVTPAEQSDTFTSTNVPVTCVLKSRSFPGSSQDSAGQYGYEYQVTLNNVGANTTVTNVLTVNSLTLAFGEPGYFAFGEHASNQVWIVTLGGPDGLAPGSATLTGTNVVVNFDPPLTLSTQTDQSTNTCYFGMIGGAPEITTAILSGSTQDPAKGTNNFTAELKAQTP